MKTSINILVKKTNSCICSSLIIFLIGIGINKTAFGLEFTQFEHGPRLDVPKEECVEALKNGKVLFSHVRNMEFADLLILHDDHVYFVRWGGWSHKCYHKKLIGIESFN